MDPLRIVMISDHETAGGAGASTSRLAEALVIAGAEVIRIVGLADGRAHRWTTINVGGGLLQRIAKKATRTFAARSELAVSTWFADRELRGVLEDFRPDVVNVRNLHGARWSPGLVETCARYAPTAWTLHDMWSFTGRCAFSYDCRRFVSGCDASCPTPAEYPALDPRLIAGAWNGRKKLLGGHPDLRAISPSRWLAHEALSGLWAGHEVDVIPNALPLDVYVPMNRAQAQSELGIEGTGPVILTSAHDLADRRKGGAILVQALQLVPQRPLTIITLGQGALPIGGDGFTVKALGYVDDEQRKVCAYNAADILVHPALAESFGNVIIEAMACGTPCVGFPLGGVQEIVRPEITGWLAQDSTPQALADALNGALREVASGTDLRTSCRAVAEAEYDVALQARRYLELFESLRKKKEELARVD